MEEFLGYSATYTSDQEKTIHKDFQRLQDQCYLEHAGATLYSEKQIENVTSQLLANLYTNPHGKNLSSKSTEDAIDVARYDILAHFNTNPEEYSVVFTSGATAALKLIAETFNYGNEGWFVYLQDNHTSVLGMRQFAENFHCITIDQVNSLINPHLTKQSNNTQNNSLFVYPAQSNFSGHKYPLNWCENIKNGALNPLTKTESKWFVALDASSYVGTSHLDLHRFQPDFVTISFHKIFGYPTGLGAVLIKKSSSHLLQKRYFGGGTVQMAQASSRSVVFRDVIHERFEDGSLNFLSILSLRHGFETIKRFNLTFDIISEHTFKLARYIYCNLVTLHHSNGNPAAVVYHNSYFENRSKQGGIVNFNLLRENGDYIGYSEVMHFANLYGIHLRTGCSCNPGACQYFLKLTAEDVQKHYSAGHVCNDQQDLIDGYPTGSVRISFGYMSTKNDGDSLLRMIEECFVTRPIVRKMPSEIEKRKLIRSTSNQEQSRKNDAGTLEKIFLYPIKSCGAFSVIRWPITNTGLKYDRLWMIINSSGVCLTQKQNRKMCLIAPFIDLHSKLLTITYPGKSKVTVPIEQILSDLNKNVFLCQSKVCNDAIQGLDCGDKVAEWLSSVLETPGLRLLKQQSKDFGKRTSKNDSAQLSLVNEAQYLLINSATLKWLKDKIADSDFDESIENMGLRFRPNLIVKLDAAFQELEMRQIRLNSLAFKVNGNCTRCQMICIDQNTGKSSKEPLRTLSKELKGRIKFGIYMSRIEVGKEEYLSVGNIATAE